MSDHQHRDFVTYELRGNIALVGLNRPEKRNAISDAFVESIAQAVARAQNEAKAAVLFGHGDHFCAGLDLAEHVKKTPIEGVRGSRRWHAVFAGIEHGTIPWFSALHGAVIGGGLELAASTHVRVADKAAFFALPEGQRGIFVGGGGSVRVARLTGVARMTDMMLTGRVVSADEGERWNIVQYVVEAGTAVEKAIALAEKAASNAEISNYAVINALPRIQDMAKEDGLFVESFISSFTATSPEAEERLRAFLEKRVAKVKAPGED
ncbi:MULTISPECIES: crotonase/enoyl-CoA hydratase family protein [unclassified Rhizobium]|uniref:crotonase/enoyl-CoA hydratase family protein n=1 Tax=unclassified Rhizobium TaxID=2613769 RepID=UPI00177D108C|nr:MULTISPECIES: crotonase/enoyl-CoA hydratase family protein [unclassified Rhizobium]MBD8687545.1 crotonase/enoyl-CoA hydratase family protein [Rhizobium sp. CFBP 13644]MBD8691999.1 crotonase/enoyl-CoA hydratase family protein [Rhizobium sp. CFBP 13717]